MATVVPLESVEGGKVVGVHVGEGYIVVEKGEKIYWVFPNRIHSDRLACQGL